MDILSIFEQKLKPSKQPIEAMEEKWNQKAEKFYSNQVNGSTYYSDAVPRLLEQKKILDPSVSVLDIGAGSGRYAIPLAKRCKSVHALDLSSEMLQFLECEIEKNNLDNIDLIKSAWPPMTEEIGKFDVSFSAMCPATRSVKALEAMSNVAKKHGVICQFTASTDNVVEALQRHQQIEKVKGPHNNRNLLQSYFNILWEIGYQPDISYLHDTFVINMSFNEALHTYQQRYEHVKAEQLGEVLSSIQQEEDSIKVIKKTTLAVITWETNKN